MQPIESPPAVPESSPDGSAPAARLMIRARWGRGPVDGAWWPYSYDASAEFPALITAMVAHVDRVERIGYDIDLWHSTTPKLRCGGMLVRCEGFHAALRQLISIISGPHDGLLLLLIAPETGVDIAHAAMSAAADSAPRDTVTDIFDRADAAANQPRRPT